MDAERTPDWHWIKVGSNPVYVAVVEGRVEAVVYRSEGVPGTDDLGNPAVTDEGWAWFPADRPELHDDVELGELPGERETTLPPEHDAALEAAASLVADHLGIGGAQ